MRRLSEKHYFRVSGRYSTCRQNCVLLQDGTAREEGTAGPTFYGIWIAAPGASSTSWLSCSTIYGEREIFFFFLQYHNVVHVMVLYIIRTRRETSNLTVILSVVCAVSFFCEP